MMSVGELMSRVKLNKLMYRADFESFRLLGRSMTGATYIKGEYGPMVKDLPDRETAEFSRTGVRECAYLRLAAMLNERFSEGAIVDEQVRVAR